MRIFFCSIVLVFLLAACSNKFGTALKSKDNEYKYKIAEQYYANKQFGFAQQLYEQLFPYIKGTDRYEDMYYKFALCFYNDKDYPNAENIFKTFAETFPASKKAEESEYNRAYCYYKQSPKVELDQTTTRKAMSLMQAFINGHPGSARNKEANDIIDVCREKLELKDFKSAELYYNVGQFRAAATAFNNLYEDFPDSKRADEYKLQVIKSYYKFAELSWFDKQEERFNKVLAECTDFVERFTESQYLTEVKKYKQDTIDYLNKIKAKNEQDKKTNKS